MDHQETMRIGDLLVQQKLITREQLTLALKQQTQSPLRLGRILVNNALVTEEDISKALATQLNIPFINLRNFIIKSKIVRLLTESQSRRFHAIVLEKRENTFLVGMVDPTDLKVIEELKQILSIRIDVAVVTEGQFLEGIDSSYWRTGEKTGAYLHL
jgi:MSHA biogenesis protein MshE